MLGGIRSGYIQRLCRTMGTRVGRDINFMDSRKQCGVIGKIMPSSKGYPILQFLQHSRDPPPNNSQRGQRVQAPCIHQWPESPSTIKCTALSL